MISVFVVSVIHHCLPGHSNGNKSDEVEMIANFIKWLILICLCKSTNIAITIFCMLFASVCALEINVLCCICTQEHQAMAYNYNASRKMSITFLLHKIRYCISSNISLVCLQEFHIVMKLQIISKKLKSPI